jgi:lipopolysaccharide export system permease protein
MILKTYQKYIIHNFSYTLFQVTIIFFCLIFVLNIFEEINFFKSSEQKLFFPILLTFLNVPSVMYEIFPFIFLISTQFFFLKIIENNELLTFKNIGLNNFRIIKIISLTSFIYSLLIIILLYNFSAKLKFVYLDLKNSYSNDNKYLAVITNNGLWIKDEIDNKINIINASKIEKNSLKNISITQFNKQYELIKTLQGKSADISNKLWLIKDLKISENNFQSEDLAKLEFNTNFDVEKINSLFSNLFSLTFWELNDLKKDYRTLGYSTSEINTHFQKILSYPFYITVMAILSSIIMLNIKYNKSKIFNIVVALLLSVIIYYLNYFFNIFGANKDMPIFLTIWIPIFIISIFACYGLININDK